VKYGLFNNQIFRKQSEIKVPDQTVG